MFKNSDIRNYLKNYKIIKFIPYSTPSPVKYIIFIFDPTIHEPLYYDYVLLM